MILNVRIDEGDGPPLVLLHGWPQHAGMWESVVPELSKRFRCIAPDLRGLGASPAPADGYDKPTLAQDVLDTMDDLGIDRASFIGHDWGCVITAIIATDHPERMVKGLMLSAPAPWDRSLDPRRLAGIAHMPIMASPLGASLAAQLGKAILRGSGVSEEAAEDYVAPMRESDRGHAASMYYRTFLLHELVNGLRSRPGKPDVPVKVVGGDRDPVCRWGTMDAKLKGEGHFIVDTAPQKVIQQAEAFL
jgi:pimeloyl-ACP methyl ester carboxylesterase